MDSRDQYKPISWSGPNEQVIETLDRYCFDDSYRDYALLINGGWGCGKTFLIKEYFEKRWTLQTKSDVKNKPIFVSLYGVSSQDEINKLIFSELHPLLGGNAGKIGSVIFKGLLKTSIKIDLDQLFEGKKGSLNLPGVDISDLGLGKNSNYNRRILVFDDFERSRMDSAEILSLIQPLVEYNDNRIIIIANESEIKKDENTYVKIKEKTIGFTLSIKPDFDSVYNKLVDDAQDETNKHFLLSCKEILRPIATSEYGCNFRTFRQSVTLFEDFFSNLDKKYKKDDYFEIFHEIIKVIYIIVIETRQNSEKIETFENCTQQGWLTFKLHKYLKKDRSPEKIEKEEHIGEFFKRLKDRYGIESIEFDTLGLSYTFLRDLIENSSVNKEELEKNIQNHPAFRKEPDQPSWYKVWNYVRHPKYAQDALPQFLEDFEKRTFKNEAGLHTCALYISFCKHNIINKSIENALSETRKYIEDILEGYQVTDEDFLQNNKSNVFSKDSAFGVGYSDRESGEFKKIYDLYTNTKNNIINSSLNARSDELLDLLKNNLDDFLNQIGTDDQKNALYAKIPILSYIKPDLFSGIIIDIADDSRKKICVALNARKEWYRHSPLNNEAPWFQEMLRSLQNKLDSINDKPLLREGLRLFFGEYLGLPDAPTMEE